MAALAVGLAGCKKADPPPPCGTVTDAPAEFLSYWYFPGGSWWVYQLKDSNPAVYDTVRAVAAARTYNERGQGEGAPECVWHYGLGLEHSNATYFPGDAGRKGAERLGSDYAGGSGWCWM